MPKSIVRSKAADHAAPFKAERREAEQIPQALRHSLIRLGYYGAWSSGDAAAAKKAGDVKAAMEFIAGRSGSALGQKPVRLEDIIDQLAASRFEGRALTFFSPWGPRYKMRSTEVGDMSPEMPTIMELSEIFKALAGMGYRSRFVLMPADVYGTEVNVLSPGFVREYFGSLGRAMERELDGHVDLLIRPWSSIRDENLETYRALAAEVSELIKPGNSLNRLLRDALRKAEKMNPENAEESARRYVIERVVEADIIGRVYDPIKISLTRKENDETDLTYLKRIYVISNRKPWMSGGADGPVLLRE